MTQSKTNSRKLYRYIGLFCGYYFCAINTYVLICAAVNMPINIEISLALLWLGAYGAMLHYVIEKKRAPSARAAYMLTLFSFLCSIPLLASTFALYWQVEHLLPGFIAVKSVMREQSWFYFSFIFILYTLISFTVLYIIYRCLSRRVAYQVQHQYRAS